MAFDKTISELLAERGYGHRRTDTSGNTGKHDVFEAKTGKVVGVFTALEAMSFLEGKHFGPFRWSGPPREDLDQT